MLITANNLPLDKIVAAELPGLNGASPKKGFKIGGAWLNGSDGFSTAAELQKHLIGKEISPSKTGKSLVVVGDFQPIDKDFLAGILTARETIALEAVDLSELL